MKISGFVACGAVARAGMSLFWRDVLLETEKLCQITSQVIGQKPVLSYLQVVNSGVLAAR